jgi:hypothetical protein
VEAPHLRAVPRRLPRAVHGGPRGRAVHRSAVHEAGVRLPDSGAVHSTDVGWRGADRQRRDGSTPLPAGGAERTGVVGTAALPVRSRPRAGGGDALPQRDRQHAAGGRRTRGGDRTRAAAGRGERTAVPHTD